MTTDLNQVIAMLSDLTCSWAVCGGWAIDLFTGQTRREHKDIDIAVFREDQLAVQAYLAERGWTFAVALKDGAFAEWPDGARIELPQHTVWCRNASFTPDFVEILLNEADDTHFRFRRDPSIRLPRGKAFITTDAGVTVLAPEIVLLYKSNNLEHAGNVADFKHALPHLNARQRDWLAAALMQLYGEHPWLDALTEQTDRIILS